METDKHVPLINRISRKLADGVQFADLAAFAVREISEQWQYAVAELWISEGGRRLSLQAHHYQVEPEPQAAANGGAVAGGDRGVHVEAFRGGQQILVEDARSDDRHVPRFPRIGSVLSSPLRMRGVTHGVLHVEAVRTGGFSPQDCMALESVSSILAHSMQGLHLFEQAQRSEEYLQAVLKASQDIAIISTDRQGYIITCSEGSERIFGYQPPQMRGRDLLTLYTDEGLVRSINDFMNGSGTEEILKKEVTELKRGERHLFLNLRLHKVRNLKSNVIGFLGITRDITETVRLEKKLFEMSVTDELTGLFNQREFFNLLEREIEKYKRLKRPLSLCFFDLDKFKQYNDTYGHLEGDRVLQKVGEFIRQSVRQHLDLAFRYGGDEFTIIMAEVMPQKAALIAERIRAAVQEHYKNRITLSIGIAPFNPGLNLRQFIQTADQAMYQAKTGGGNRIVAL